MSPEIRADRRVETLAQTGLSIHTWMVENHTNMEETAGGAGADGGSGPAGSASSLVLVLGRD